MTKTPERLVAALSFFFFFLDRGRVKTDQREPTVDFGRRSSLVNENKRKPTNMTLGEGAEMLDTYKYGTLFSFF